MKSEAAAKTRCAGGNDGTRDSMLPPIVSRHARPNDGGRVLVRTSLVVAAVVLSSCRDESNSTPNLELGPVADHPTAALMGVGGSSPSDVWMVGATPVPNGGPLVLRRTDDGLTTVDTGQLHDLWWVHGFPSGEVFLGGAGATVLRVRGDEIERLATPGFAGQTVFGLWGAAPDDVWAVGAFAGREGFVWRYDGTTWTAVDLPEDMPRLGDGEMPPLLKVWGRAADDVWIVGGAGSMLHWDGDALAVVDSGTGERLFTVAGNDDDVYAVGGSTAGVVVRGGPDGFVDESPEDAPLLQALAVDGSRVWIAGAYGYAARRTGADEWEPVDLGFAAAPESVHAMWTDGEALWAVGGGVLSPALDKGAAVSSIAIERWAPPTVEPPDTSCPADAIDRVPDGSIARRWNEQLLDSIRRDLPNPPLHARNLHHTSVAMYDAWAAYDTAADGVFSTERATGSADDRDVAISYAAYRVLKHRYSNATNAATTLDCYDRFMAVLGLDPNDTHTSGDDPIAVGNRIGALVIEQTIGDGCNEANGYADTTGWAPTNPVLVVDRPGAQVDDPNVWQQLNLALAETQNGIVLDSTVQPYIGPHWREVRPFAIERDPDTGLYGELGLGVPDTDDAELVDWVVEVLRKTAELDHLDGEMIDTSPGARGNNPLGTNDGTGYATNPVTGEPYAPRMVPRGDFTRVVAEMWADGPKSETPPGHWAKLSNEVSDRLSPDELRPFGADAPVDRLAWDVGIYLAVTGATHDAAISAWELKRESLGPRPITLVRWMAQNGQRSDPALPNYSPDGLPIVPGLIEPITAQSSAPGERHHHLRFHVGELAVWSWPGEPGNRADEFTPLQWMRALDWIPYQRRTFVTPAFPGFTSGHSTFSRAAAEALAAYTGSPYFPGGLHEFVAPAGEYLVFEDGPSVDVHLQWASYFDAADQAGQSRLWGGIHLWPDDAVGRENGARAGIAAAARAQEYLLGTFRE